jgi:zinc protease
MRAHRCGASVLRACRAVAFTLTVASLWPALAGAQRLADSATTSFEVNGLRVIHRRVTANEVVAANLYLLGGVSVVPASKAGLELLLLEASERGTRKYPREVLERNMARLGSAIVASPSIDWTMVGVRSTVSAFDSTFAIFADRIMQPRLDSSEVETVRSTIISGVRQRGDDPEALLNAFSDSVAFAGHPYGTSPVGTEATLRSLTLTDLRAWQKAQMVTSRMLLVVVGDVPRARLEAMIRASLGTLPRGEYKWAPPLVPAARASSLHVIARSLPTNYLQGYWIGPRADSRDYQPMRIAMAALGGRLFTEVRVKRNLTYAVNAPFVDRALTAPGLYVTTTAPDSVLGIMRREVDAMKRGFIDPEGLRLLVQQFITEFFLDNETNSDQATFLARTELYRGDYKLASRFVDELRKVTPEDIQRVARQYLTGITMAYVGDPRRITASRVTPF